MARTAALSKTQMAERLCSVFKAEGYAGASLTLLAEAAQLKRASLYHHFPNGKIDMAKAALAYSGALFMKHIIIPCQTSSNAQAGFLDSLGGVLKYYASETPTGTPAVCLMNVLNLGPGHQFFGRDIAKAFQLWQSTWNQALDSLILLRGSANNKNDMSAQTYITAIQGTLITARLTQDTTALPQLIEAQKAEIRAFCS